MTLEQLADKLTMKAKLVRDDLDEDNLDGFSHWEVTLGYGGKSLTVPYFAGPAHRRHRLGNKKIQSPMGRMTIHDVEELLATIPTTPDKLDVLHCLVSDAQCTEYEDFEGFCGNMGYNTDSIKARDTFLACIDTRAKLSRMFDLDELYDLFQDY